MLHVDILRINRPLRSRRQVRKALFLISYALIKKKQILSLRPLRLCGLNLAAYSLPWNIPRDQ